MNDVAKGTLKQRTSFNPWLRRIVVLGAPVLVGVEIAFVHPLLPGGVRDLFPIANFWLILHVVQLVLFGLLGLAAYLLIDGVTGIFASISRIAVAFYVLFYNAADSVAGISTGVLARGASDLPEREQAAIAWAIGRLFEDPTKQLLYISGMYFWIAALLAAVFALYRAGAPRLPLLLLALGTLPYIDFFGFDHSPPFHPIALGLFFLAALWLELTWRKRDGIAAIDEPQIADREETAAETDR